MPRIDKDDVDGIVAQAVNEYLYGNNVQDHTSYQDELAKERARRIELEKRVEELVAENRITREHLDHWENEGGNGH